MERCVSNYPLCTPYRGILIGRRRPYQSGIVHNDVPIGTDEYGFGTAFHDAGYRTLYVGRWHLQGDDRSFVPPGPGRQDFEDWHAWGDTNAHDHSYTFDPDTGDKIHPPVWTCTRMTDQAIEFLERQSGRRSASWPASGAGPTRQAGPVCGDAWPRRHSAGFCVPDKPSPIAQLVPEPSL